KTKYVSADIIMRWSVARLKLSYPQTMKYIDNNYSFPKDMIARKMLGLVNRSPGRIDYFFKGLTYFGLGSAIIYSAVKNTLNL
ncbi:MAG: hypothetical protein NT120_01255, partial [Candidatus Aenigmarchaeota archaeon]|nr:hypothetical protein [Candidatus Aenigmarchaeota archaeon]